MDDASCDWVAFVGDDDLWSPWKLRRQLDSLIEQPSARWCLVGTAVVDEELCLLRVDEPPAAGDVEATLLYRNAVPGGCSGVMVARDLLNQVGGFDESLSMMADWDLLDPMRWRLAGRVGRSTARRLRAARSQHVP